MSEQPPDQEDQLEQVRRELLDRVESATTYDQIVAAAQEAMTPEVRALIESLAQDMSSRGHLELGASGNLSGGASISGHVELTASGDVSVHPPAAMALAGVVPPLVGEFHLETGPSPEVRKAVIGAGIIGGLVIAIEPYVQGLLPDQDPMKAHAITIAIVMLILFGKKHTGQG